MRGQVLGVNLKTGEGQVAGDDGRRYTFRPDDWAHRGEPSVGALVDFETSDTRALNIFPLPAHQQALATVASAPPPAPRSDRSKWIAAILAFFFGPLGVHRFYTGRTGSGIVMLILSITVVGLLVSVPWAWIDTIRYLVMGDREFDHRYARLPAPR
jgi:TM2 domain-containing membrane protein YozV